MGGARPGQSRHMPGLQQPRIMQHLPTLGAQAHSPAQPLGRSTAAPLLRLGPAWHPALPPLPSAPARARLDSAGRATPPPHPHP
jgi:hypothetical protein